MLFLWQKKKTRSVQPYEKLARVYDYLMSHVNYDQWADYIWKLIQRYHPDAKKILDLACGTASFLKAFQKPGLELLGCDSSFPMVREARVKMKESRIPLWCADMVTVGLRQQVDVVLCLYDSLNYLMEPSAVARFLQNSWQLLGQSGILIFDICTEKNSLRYFANYFDHASEADFTYDRWSHYDQKQKIQFTEFKLQFKGESELYHEVHQQRIYAVSEMLDLIVGSPFNLVAYFDGFSTRPASSRSNRIHFILRKVN